MNGQTTTFTMDLNMGLTQALSDGTNTYIYGVGRIAQVNTNTEYFLGDALGSVRQLADAGGVITYASAYDPYGVATTAGGSSQTAYGYTSEYTANDMVYLRARYYAPSMGRFMTRDTWMGDYNRPLSINHWNYTNADPINWIDPSGMITEQKADEAQKIINSLRINYNVLIQKDWGYRETILYMVPESVSIGCHWEEGNWKSLRELKLVKQAVTTVANKLGGDDKFRAAMKQVRVRRIKEKGQGGYTPPMSLPSPLSDLWGDLRLPDTFFNQTDGWDRYTLAHELGHRWDFETGFALSKGLMTALGTWICDKSGKNCDWYPYAKYLDPVTLDAIWEIPAGVRLGCTGEPPFTKQCPEAYALTYGFGGKQPWEGLAQYYTFLPGIEDWAETFANFIYPAYYPSIGWSGLVPIGIRENYVKKQIDLLQ